MALSRSRTLKKSSRKRPTRLLVRGGTLLTMVAGVPAAVADLLIEDGVIQAIGPRLPCADAAVIEAGGMLVLPGFIQAHTQLSHTLLRGQAAGRDYFTWLHDFAWPYEAQLSGEALTCAARLGMAELLLGGTTSVLDVGPTRHQDGLFVEAERMGLRYTGGQALIDQGQGYPAGLKQTADVSLAESDRLWRRWHNAAHGRLRYAYAPRGLLTTSASTLMRIAALAHERGVCVQLPIAETGDEAALVLEKLGKHAAQILAEVGLLAPHTVLTHGTWLTAQERRLIREGQAGVAHLPSTDLALGGGVARVAEMRRDGLCVMIGCGSPSLSGHLDVLRELQLAAHLQDLKEGPGTLGGEALLSMVTAQAAQALGLPEVGVLAAGKRADLVLWDLQAPHGSPCLRDLATRFIQSARAADAHTVIVDGIVRVKARKLLGVKVGELVVTAQRLGEQLLARIG